MNTTIDKFRRQADNVFLAFWHFLSQFSSVLGAL